MRVKSLAQEHNTMTLAGSVNLESSALTIRPLHLHHCGEVAVLRGCKKRKCMDWWLGQKILATVLDLAVRGGLTVQYVKMKSSYLGSCLVSSKTWK